MEIRRAIAADTARLPIAAATEHRPALAEVTAVRLTAAALHGTALHPIAAAAQCLPTTEGVRLRTVEAVDPVPVARRLITVVEAEEAAATTAEVVVADRMVEVVEVTPAVTAKHL